jgi:hypothetical protein
MENPEPKRIAARMENEDPDCKKFSTEHEFCSAEL